MGVYFINQPWRIIGGFSRPDGSKMGDFQHGGGVICYDQNGNTGGICHIHVKNITSISPSLPLLTCRNCLEFVCKQRLKDLIWKKMSSQRGNAARTRPQKHQNSRVFKNNLHDKSKRTKIINSTQIINSCDRCKAIIEWKIKYKKYKQLKSAKTCVKCSNKTVKHSYHTICGLCVQKFKVCAKCGTTDFKNATDTPDQHLSEVNLQNEESEESEEETDDEDDENT